MSAWYVILLLIAGVVVFSLEKLSVDIVTVLLLLALIGPGILTPEEAFSGFSNDIIIMLASVFIISTALRDTGILDASCNLLLKWVGTRLRTVLTSLMGGVSFVSAFMNNTTVTSMFVGPVVAMARQLRIPASLLLMPLAFASIMGGTCTLIGTSTNVAVSGYMAKAGLEPVGMFEITSIGLILVVAGTAYMLLVGLRLLPKRRGEGKDDLSYRTYLAEVVILKDSPLIGQEIHRSDFSVLGFQVLKIMRHGRDLGAMPHERLEEADTVMVAGKVEDLIKIKTIEGLDIQEDINFRATGVDQKDTQIVEVVLTPRSPLVGTTLRRSLFRQRTGLSVLAIHRGAEALMKQLGDVQLQAGDVLLIQGPYERIHDYEQEAEMVVVSQHEHAVVGARAGFYTLIAFLLAVVLTSFNLVPISVAMLAVAVFAVLIKAINLETAYENIDWRLLVLIAGMTAFGQAMTKTGASDMLANGINAMLSPFGPYALLAGFCILTVLLTQPMSNAAAALVVLPVAIQAAVLQDLNPRTFGIGVMLSASISMLTPFEPSCILVYGPGKYRFKDFLIVGGGLTLVLVTLIIALLPVFWPLKA
jgi:di/tricarboxylate transporter